MGFTALLYAALCDAIRPADIGNRLLISREPQITSLEPQRICRGKRRWRRSDRLPLPVSLAFEPKGASVLAQG